jgi:O-antigen/teichoic acid export membrane protein
MKTGAVQLATYGIGLVGGIAAVAGIRAAQLLLGPLNILFSGITLALMPRAVELRDASLPVLPKAMRTPSLVLGGASTGLGLILSVAPTELLEVAIGDQAAELSRYVLPLALSLAASGLITGSSIGLRALAAGRSLIIARALSAGLTLAGGWIGFAVAQSALGGLWGLAVGALLGVPAWVNLFTRAVRDYQHKAVPPPSVVWIAQRGKTGP